MGKTIEFTVEVVDGKVWGRLRRSSGNPAETPINELLRWVVEQINFGNWVCTPDDKGDVTSLVIGAAAAEDAEETTIETVTADVRARLFSVNLAGVFARGREEGIEPSGAGRAETVRMTATDGAYANTELHYTFELLDILARIRGHSFVFTSPPIKGIASADIVTLLREATRAYLFNLRRSCVSLCRALVEATLRGHVSPTELLNERWQSKKGELECLINVSARCGLLTPRLSKQAHAVRKAGNRALHGSEPADDDAWAVLLDTRAVVESVCSKP